MGFLASFLGTPLTGVGYMQFLNDIPAQMMEKMAFRTENIPVFFTWIVAYITGFLLYTYAGKVTKQQGVQPYPLWIHCYMFSIDVIGTATYWYLAATHHFFWYFCVQGIALPMWLFLEAQSIRAGIKNKDEREFEYGRYRKGGVSASKTKLYCLGIFLIGFFLNMWGLSLIGGMANAAIWVIYPFTNYVYAIFTWRFWDDRAAQFGNKKHNSIGLQVVIIATCIVSWCPGLSWYWAVSPFFHQPWYLLSGIACTAVAVYNLIQVRKLPDYVPEEDTEKVVAEANE